MKAAPYLGSDTQSHLETSRMAIRTLAKIAAAALTLALALSQGAVALETKPYDAAAFKAAQEAGQSILVDVFAPWCPTCKAQHKVLESLKSKPEYAAITVFQVDFDTQTDALKAFSVNQQSTLIAFKGGKETARSVGATKAEAIEKLLAATK